MKYLVAWQAGLNYAERNVLMQIMHQLPVDKNEWLCLDQYHAGVMPDYTDQQQKRVTRFVLLVCRLGEKGRWLLVRRRLGTPGKNVLVVLGLSDG